MNISYEYYRAFYYAGKHLSFTRAAQVMGSNQPNVTRTIKKLETALGCPLFVRRRKGVNLTPEGRKLYQHIAAAVAHIQAGEGEITQAQQLQTGQITMAASEIALRCVLLPVLRQFRQAYPGVRIRVLSQTTAQAITLVSQGLADFAVVTASGIGSVQGLSSQPIRSIQETPVCGRAYQHLTKEQLTLARLLDYPLISLGRHTSSFAFYSALFSQQGLSFTPDIEAAAADQILLMAQSDLGIGFVPAEFLAGQEDVFALTLTQPLPPRTVCLFKRNDGSLGIAAKTLERMLCYRQE